MFSSHAATEPKIIYNLFYPGAFMGDDDLNPEYNSSLLFSMQLATAFYKCSQIRDSSDILKLFRSIESLSLMLTGYYAKKPEDSKKIEAQVTKKISGIKDKLDLALRDYEDTRELKIPKDLWQDIYDMEMALRYYWKASGLQMSMKSKNPWDSY